jgi:hypothetical protein
MVNALYATIYHPAFAPAYDEQIIARAAREVQQQHGLWFPRLCGPVRTTPTQKKSRRRPAALKVDNREASNRVDRSHSVSKRGQFQS